MSNKILRYLMKSFLSQNIYQTISDLSKTLILHAVVNYKHILHTVINYKHPMTRAPKTGFSVPWSKKHHLIENTCIYKVKKILFFILS